MSHYLPPLRDLRFVLHELLEIEPILRVCGHADADASTIDQVLAAAGKFAADVLNPINACGDREGCLLRDGATVSTPAGFREAYAAFVDCGWPALACAPEHGGQGFPEVVNAAALEMFGAANMAWTAYPGMSHAAYVCLSRSGSEAQKSKYLPKLASGQWAGTMCLTEPQAGTDLGLLRTRAASNPDGSYSLTGTKIFISGGEQDLTENIVHLVLARLPDAPPGLKGISLFVVPKFLESRDAGIGERNAVFCGSLEEKLGIHGNSTCTMNFEGAKGWMVAKPNAGLAAMFVMMNTARLLVGVNAVGLMDAAYQRSLAYAKDRLQGKAGRSGAGTCAIVEHPDVRRMLLTQKAYVEGCRALALWATHLLDMERSHPDSAVRAQSAALVALVTPVVKAFSSDAAVECANTAMQVFGGHGYIRESGIEQYLRDARIIPLYEGANGVQAMDLLARKILADGGERLEIFLAEIRHFVSSHQSDSAGTEFSTPLLHVAALVESTVRDIKTRCLDDEDEVGAAASPFLRMMGHLCLAYVWARMAVVAQAGKDRSDPVYASKLATANFYFRRLLPEALARHAEIKSGSACLMSPSLDLL